MDGCLKAAFVGALLGTLVLILGILAVCAWQVFIL